MEITHRKQLEEHGEAYVRAAMHAYTWGPNFIRQAWAWLAEIDAERQQAADDKAEEIRRADRAIAAVTFRWA